MKQTRTSIKDTLYSTKNSVNEMITCDMPDRFQSDVKPTAPARESTHTNTNMNQNNFRPKSFDEVIGQQEVKDFLRLKITAFKKTRVSLVHTLFLGFSGVGKTTLANVVANEMGVRFHQIMATRIRSFADLRNVLRGVEENDVVFIDEIHALSEKLQEQLYGIMEDFVLTEDDKNLNRQVITRIPRFTLIGATTHSGDLNAPLLSRFQYKAHLLPYSNEELAKMITSAGKRIYNVDVPYDIAHRLATLSRKTARVAYTLLRSLMDVAEAHTTGKVTPEILTYKLMTTMLKYEKIDPIIGLDYTSRKYLVALLREKAPIGSKTIGNMINEQESTVVGMIEPFLLSDIEIVMGDKVKKSPFIRITKLGRVALEPAVNYMNTCQTLQKQDGWFANESLNFKSE
jgi:Holliday junction DNA helicase RuvB